MNHYLTPDLCDAYPELVQVLEPMFSNFGGRDSFGGEIVTATGAIHRIKIDRKSTSAPAAVGRRRGRHGGTISMPNPTLRSFAAATSDGHL